MPAFLIYEGKVAVALLVFYLFYRFLLKKETFHRFNRVVLVGTAVLSFLLPLCVITIHRPMNIAPAILPMDMADGVAAELAPTIGALKTASGPWWPTALAILFFAGIAFVLGRLAVSILSIVHIIRRGECVREEDGCRVIVTVRDIDPFSWMRYIVLFRKDWEDPHGPILVHEKAHVAYGHSVELMLVDLLSALQWFNPAIWMLRADLQELHEYEADDAVLRSGANIKEYQYLLIRKAVSKSGYSVANSFNHSILKNRITMMSKPESLRFRRLRVLCLIPLICLGIFLQAKTIAEKEKVLQEIVVVKYTDPSVNSMAIKHIDNPGLPQVSGVPDVDTMPVCSENFAFWLNQRILYPDECMYDGTVLIRFTVGRDGTVDNIDIIHGVCDELDNELVRLIAKSPSWTPATKGGKTVDLEVFQPVEFQIRTIGQN